MIRSEPQADQRTPNPVVSGDGSYGALWTHLTLEATTAPRSDGVAPPSVVLQPPYRNPTNSAV